MFGIGFIKSLHEKKEKDGCHVVPLSDTNSVVNFHFVLCIDFELEFEVTMERRWCTISFQDLEQELMVGSIKCFDEVNKKDVGVKAVFLLELEGKSKAEECIDGATLWL
jgi:hypothetical protein